MQWFCSSDTCHSLFDLAVSIKEASVQIQRAERLRLMDVVEVQFSASASSKKG